MGTDRMNKITNMFGRWSIPIAISMFLLSFMLAVSFQLINNHAWYWGYAPIIFILGALFSVVGSLILGAKIGVKVRGNLWLKIVGVVFISVWFSGGLLGMTYTIPGLNYLSGFSMVDWNDYHGDYLIGMYCIRLLQLSILAGLLGGFFLSLGWSKKTDI